LLIPSGFNASQNSDNNMDMAESIRRLEDSQGCVNTYDNEVLLYNILVGVSLSVTFIVAILYCVYIRPRLGESPGMGSRFYSIASIFKAFIAILIAAIFVPKCPEGCACEDSAHFYIYPAVALFVAFRWWLRARVLMRQQQEQVHEAIPEASVMVSSGGSTQIKATEVV
jgi:hypothetical protein